MMDTQQIMRTSLRLAGFKSVPADSEIHVKGRRIRKVLVAIDVGVAELLLARDLGCDAVIAHHPAGGRARLDGYKVFLRHIDQLKEYVLWSCNITQTTMTRPLAPPRSFACL